MDNWNGVGTGRNGDTGRGIWKKGNITNEFARDWGTVEMGSGKKTRTKTEEEMGMCFSGEST